MRSLDPPARGASKGGAHVGYKWGGTGLFPRASKWPPELASDSLGGGSIRARPRLSMADEYSDEEFAADDAEQTYDAEFDDEDADEDPHAAAGKDEGSVDPQNDTGGLEEDENGAGAVVTESEQPLEDDHYDAEFEDHEGESAAVEHNEIALPANPERRELLNEFGSLDIETAGTVVDPVPAVGSSPLAEKEAKLLLIAQPSHSVGRRSSDSRLFASSVQQFDRLADPELDEHRLMRRRSSPRVRPVPIARLASLGELAAAAPDDLEIPTNEITAEAAALVSGVVTPDSSSVGLVKRTSSSTFVPRLPSLHEISLDLPGVSDGGPHSVASSEPDAEKQLGDVSDNDEGKMNLDDEASAVEGDEYSDDELYVDGLKDRQFSTLAVRGEELALVVDNIDTDAKLISGVHQNNMLNWVEVVVGEGSNQSGVVDSAGEIEIEGTDAAIPRGGKEIVHSAIDMLQEVADTTADRVIDMNSEDKSFKIIEDDHEPNQSDHDEVDYFVDIDERRETNALLEEAQAVISQQIIVAAPILEAQDGFAVYNDNFGDMYQDDESFSDEYDEEDPTQELTKVPNYIVDFEDGEDSSKLPGAIAEIIQAAPAQSSIISGKDAVHVRDSSDEVGNRQDEVNSSTVHAVQAVRISPHSNPSIHPSPENRTEQKQKSPSRPSQRIFQVAHRNPSKSSDATTKRRPLCQEPAITISRPHSNPAAPARKPAVPRFQRKAPVPIQQPLLILSPNDLSSPIRTVESPKTDRATQTPRLKTPVNESGSTKSRSSGQKEVEQRSPSPPARSPRKPSVFKQKKSVKTLDADVKSKKLKPVKCPPNLRIDLPHADKEKREWLLLNMFRHGDDTSQYDPFIPTITPELTTELHVPGSGFMRPISARRVYGELDPQTRPSVSRGVYGRHEGRRIVDRPVDPRLRERERNWVSTNPSVTSIPVYDSILDKFCKTVTSPVVQRRIYETRMDDLSPQLAMVLEKRAFKEWKYSESEGFGAVSNSYKTAIVAANPATSSNKMLYTPRPPASSHTTSTGSLPPGS